MYPDAYVVDVQRQHEHNSEAEEPRAEDESAEVQRHVPAAVASDEVPHVPNRKQNLSQHQPVHTPIAIITQDNTKRDLTLTHKLSFEFAGTVEGGGLQALRVTAAHGEVVHRGGLRFLRLEVFLRNDVDQEVEDLRALDAGGDVALL